MTWLCKASERLAESAAEAQDRRMITIPWCASRSSNHHFGLGHVSTTRRRLQLMRSISNLPQELLGEIVDLVLATERVPPSTAPAKGHGRRTAHTSARPGSRRKIYYISEPAGLKQVMWNRGDPYISNAYPLLLVSHGMAAITRTAVARAAKSPNGLVYKLDLMLVNERCV